MMSNKYFLLLASLFFLLTASHRANAQEDLLALIADDDEVYVVQHTFKSTRLINGQTSKLLPNGVLDFLISHRFGSISTGVNEFYGLDDAQVRLGLEYGISDHFNIGIGRSSYQKIVDSFVKMRLLSQKNVGTPLTITAFSSAAIKTGPYAFYIAANEHDFVHRLKYTSQLIFARKMNDKLSLLVSPTWVHKNLVEKTNNPNDFVAIGLGARYKLSNRVTFNSEWYPQLGDQSQLKANAFSLGVDIETGGHVFQLHLTNARAMIEQGFITENEGTWQDGNIHFGFNISRVFDLKTRK